MRVLSGKVNLGRKINLSKRKKSSSNWWWWESNLEACRTKIRWCHAAERDKGKTEGGGKKTLGAGRKGKKIKTSEIYGHYAPEIHWFAICLLHLENSLLLGTAHSSRIGFFPTTTVNYC